MSGCGGAARLGVWGLGTQGSAMLRPAARLLGRALLRGLLCAAVRAPTWRFLGGDALAMRV